MTLTERTQTFHDLVPAELRRSWSESGIYPDVPVFTLFDRVAQVDPDRVAVLDDAGTTTYGELRDLALRLAGGFRERGLGTGDVIACQLPNSRWSCAVDLAAAAIGGIVLPFPAGRGHRDMQSLLSTSRARAVVVPAKYGETDIVEALDGLRPELPHLEHVFVLDTISDTLGEPADPAALPPVDPDAVVRMLVSSGSESAPKLVAYSHNALVGGRGQFLARLQPAEVPMRAMFLIPLGSSFGSCATFGVLCTLGGSLVLQEDFSVSGTLRAVERHRPTHLLGVPTMFQRLLASPMLTGTDVSSLVAVVSGGALVDPPTVARVAAGLDCAFVSLYGSADGVNCHTLLTDTVADVQHSLGVPNPSVCSIRIVDDEDADVDEGHAGEVLARGPLSPHCYVNAPELDGRYRTADGWVRTGDVGYIDPDGRLRLVGRKKDIVIRGGANISPAEVEGLLSEHPAVVGAVCIGVDDADLGQRLCACVMPAPHQPRPDLVELQEFLRGRGLEPKKFPEYLLISDEFPFTPAGKVDKRLLAERVREAGPDPVPGK